jgi:septation ring formation regulator EzrA
MLYIPWRDESSDLLRGYMDFRSHYEDKIDDILANEWKYTENASEIDEAIDNLSMDHPSMHGTK